MKNKFFPLLALISIFAIAPFVLAGCGNSEQLNNVEGDNLINDAGDKAPAPDSSDIIKDQNQVPALDIQTTTTPKVETKINSNSDLDNEIKAMDKAVNDTGTDLNENDISNSQLGI